MKKQIIIAGGGNCGWITALFLRNMFSHDTHEIILIASEKIGTIGVGESTIPYVVDFLRSLGLKESEILSRCNGTIKTGVQFTGWNKSHSFIHPFTSGLSSKNIEGKPFAYWYHANKGKNFERDVDMGQLLIEDNIVPFNANMKSYYEYAYHLDANLLGAYIKEICLQKQNNIVYRNELILSVIKEKDIVTQITTRENTYSPDIVFDCSGFHEVIIKHYTKNTYISFQKDLPCDIALFAPSKNVTPIPNYTLSETMNAGWMWKIPLQNRMGNGYVFSSRYLSEEDAKQEFYEKTSIPINTMKTIHFKSGYHKESWIGNTISIGSSYGFVEPLEGTGIYLFCKQLEEFKKAYTSKTPDFKKQDSYNIIMEKELLEIRDFIYFHYHGSQRRDTSFWNHFKNFSLEKQIQEKLIFLKNNFPDESLNTPYNVFKKESYTRILIGMGFYNTFAFSEDLNDAIRLEIKGNLIKMLYKKYSLKHIFITHEDFIAQIKK